MARLPRFSPPGHPQHLIQRGHDRQPIARDAEDKERLLTCIRESAAQHAVAVHAYVIMDNHLHLLATPQAADSLSRMMQGVGRQYVRQFNQRHGRTGTLWEGRFRSSVIEAERHLLACMVYIDLNPVRAGMVASPQDYRWSSHRHYVGQQPQRWLTPHALYWALGNTPFAREAAYAALTAAGLPERGVRELRAAVQAGRALGGADFIDALEASTGRRLRPARRGRPPAHDRAVEPEDHERKPFDVSPILWIPGRSDQ